MAKFRKKPVVIEAEQWRPGKRIAGVIMAGDNGFPGTMPANEDGTGSKPFPQDHGWVSTLEGGHIVSPGDWIITGVKGEKYPCKPDIFDATYEPVTD